MLVVNLSTPEGLTAEYRLKEPRAWNGNGARKFGASRHVPDDPGNLERLLLELTRMPTARAFSHRIEGQLLRESGGALHAEFFAF